jgi:DNA-binding winged helix-turn-helix (wHTH) protein
MRERYRIADLTLDVEAVSVTRGGQPVPLPKLSFDLLVELARRAPDVVRSDELIERVWAGTAVSDETLTQRVALLRRALGEEAKSPRYVRAVRGRGYQLIPEVLIPEALAANAAVPPREVKRRRRLSFRARVAVTVLSVALAGVGVYDRGRSNPKPTRWAVATGAPSVPELLARAGSYLRQHQAANNELAIELYRRALRIEPGNPRALAGLSLALGQRATKFNQRDEATGEALELARRALAIDPRLALAHEALGLALDSRGEVAPALAEYRQAAALDPTRRCSKRASATPPRRCGRSTPRSPSAPATPTGSCSIPISPACAATPASGCGSRRSAGGSRPSVSASSALPGCRRRCSRVAPRGCSRSAACRSAGASRGSCRTCW